ncbi:YceI family protein [Crocinitomix catalasitica]|uniref:YceI family protein n=1 Tax=Crocinitomix catalasitica TaxID=184607 RepID=UPI0004813D80|nr:YceI family protein [Crocinitomix catalasitica]
MKKSIVLGLGAVALLFASCGGASEGSEVAVDSTEVEVVVESIVKTFNVDTAATVITWANFSEGEVDHQGTVSALNGTAEVTITGEEAVITAATLVIDMNSISEESEKLVGHLGSPDFFALETYPTSSFTFDRHENGMIYGSVNVLGKDLAVEAPAEVIVTEGALTVNVGEFKADFGALEMPFFVTEKAEKPEAEWHNASIQFSATIKATEPQ